MNETKITIIDEFPPETIAMMQALYSRSSESVEKHKEKVLQTGSDKFMNSYYVGYGHSSIGDCGNTTIFFEGLSILAAKAIQDSQKFNGQETSSRFINFSEQNIYNPLKGNHLSEEILYNWMQLYIKVLDYMQYKLTIKFPLKEGEDISIWNKAINARAFDVARGFLPAGITTQTSWHTSLRDAYEKLYELKFHPLEEVRDIANITLEDLKQKYPSSFSHKENKELDNYYKENALNINYLETYLTDDISFVCDNNILTKVSYDSNKHFDFKILSNRPKYSKIPKYYSKLGIFNLKFKLDYGSFRDIQRHRKGLCEIPLMCYSDGFNGWYLEQVDYDKDIGVLLYEQYQKMQILYQLYNISDVDLQYFTPLGNNVICELSYDLPQMVYVAELRSNLSVHPTLRKIAHKMADFLEQEFPDIKLYIDRREDKFNINRGKQDIVSKN